MKKIAVIGSGISGLTAAYLLSREHQVTLFESADRLGGHTATVDIEMNGQQYAVDTGFIVFNDWTYPNFIKLLGQLGVDRQATEMSFSVQHLATGIEYNGNSLSTLFAQRRNLLNLRFHWFLYEIVRFNILSKRALGNAQSVGNDTLATFLNRNGFSDYFAEHYILPMVAAIWSSSIDDAARFPFKFFLSFFSNHGLLNIINRPQWYVVKDGSRSYIPAMIRQVSDVRVGCPVQSIQRSVDNVIIRSCAGSEQFDDVILACHSDQALKLLADANDLEKSILADISYRENDVVLHTDRSLLPQNRKAWASWNFWQGFGRSAPPAVTYNMNILQGLDAGETFCVTLNRSDAIDEDKVLRRFSYAHPVFDDQSLAAQQRRDEICGSRHTHFCGAYWYNGFHEDGVRSALDVCKRFGLAL